MTHLILAYLAALALLAIVGTGVTFAMALRLLGGFR